MFIDPSMLVVIVSSREFQHFVSPTYTSNINSDVCSFVSQAYYCRVGLRELCKDLLESSPQSKQFEVTVEDKIRENVIILKILYKK